MAGDKFLTVAIFLLGLLMMAAMDFTDAQIGVCYGMLGSALPPPSEVVALYKQYNIQRMRLYRPYEPALQALSGSKIEVMLGVPNVDLQNIASSKDNASKWVRTNVISHPNVNFKYIAVGNEVSPLRNTTDYADFLLPAMRNIQNAISVAGLEDRIKVSTPVEIGLTTNTYPPSSGEFLPEVQAFINPIIQFLVNNSAPLLVNVYPYFIRDDNYFNSSLDYALFKSDGITMPDGAYYQNLFDAMLDATYSAVEKAGGSSLQIVVSETGWPTNGGIDTTVESAKTYNNKLIQHVKQGSPKRPGVPIETYIFSMFDEDQKLGAERIWWFWGLFSPDKQPKYEINFNTENDQVCIIPINNSCVKSGEHYAICWQ